MVICVCPTANRPGFLRWAVQGFMEQTYAESRLFIFDTSREKPVADHSGGRIVHVWAGPPAGIKFGELRNVSTQAALAGFAYPEFPEVKYVAHWDDDDWYAPERLARQVALLQQSRKAMTGMHSSKFTNGERWWKYQGTGGFSMDASLMYRPTWFRQAPFDNGTHIGPEVAFTGRAAVAGELVAIDGAADLKPGYSAGDLMVVRCHRSNTSPKHPGGNWKPLN